MVIADAALRIDEVMGGPESVVERAPQIVAVVERDRITDAEIADRAGDVRRLALEGELGRVNADHDEAVLAIFLVPRLHVRQRPQAVDAAVGPEIDHNDLAFELVAGERAGIEPR